MSGPKQNDGMAEVAALPIAQSAYATFDEWVAAIDGVAQGQFLEEGWRDWIDSMLDIAPDFDDLDDLDE